MRYLKALMRRIATLIICSFILSVLPPTAASREDIDLTIHGEVLSVRLKEIPLRIILEKLEREKGIWFRGDSSPLDETITVQFTDLPLEEGLTRILASINYSLVFNRNERLVGVIVVANGPVDRPVSKVRTDDSKRTISFPSVNERASVNRPVTSTTDSSPQGSFIKVIKEDREDFEIIRNCPPPTGPAKISAQESENFKVIKNFPPPSGPGKVTEGDREKFTVIRDCPPPGGPVDISAQQLEQFRVIENCPPPGS